MEFALLAKNFGAWMEAQAVITYSNLFESKFACRSPKSIPVYLDPLGKEHESHRCGDFSPDTTMIVPGDVHRQTHPLSYGTIPYQRFERKLATTHTSGWSPWDYIGMVDLAMISRDEPEKARNCRLMFIMNRKFYDRFMDVPWSSEREEVRFYEDYKDRIDKLIEQGYVVLDQHEPSQFWLSKVPRKVTERVDEVGIALNWANFKTGRNVGFIVSQLEKYHEITGKRINIKMHSFLKKSFLKYFDDKDYINVYRFDEFSKYDFMDSYTTYVVDGTGLGYEIAFRGKDEDIDVIDFDGLEAEDSEFLGLREMKASPVRSLSDYINGYSGRSNFERSIIESTYPYRCSPDEIPNEIGRMFLRHDEELRLLDE